MASKSDDEVIQHVFDPGFSTHEEVTEISGRGIGMDAIQAEVSALSGKCRGFSNSGQGTTVEILVPKGGHSLS